MRVIRYGDTTYGTIVLRDIEYISEELYMLDRIRKLTTWKRAKKNKRNGCFKY